MPEHDNEHELKRGSHPQPDEGIHAPDWAFDEKHDVPPAPGPGWETRDFVRRRAAFFAAMVLLGLVVVTAAITLVLHRYLEDLSAAVREEPLPTQTETAFAPPAPLLQADPHIDIHSLAQREERRLSTYGWVNEEEGVAHIPIDRAIDLTLREGLAHRQEEPAAPETPGTENNLDEQ